MRRRRFRAGISASLIWLVCALAVKSWAGGSGLNTLVVANQNSSNSLELANYYCEARAIPPDNVLRIAWPGGNTSWSNSDFQNYLVTPLLNMLASRQLTNQIDYVVLSMDLPFQTINADGMTYNGTTSALFYGLKPVGSDYSGVSSSYAASEAIFRLANPSSAPGYSFLTVMITSDSLAHAKQLVDQGVASDGTVLARPVILANSSDPARNIRYAAFDNAIFNVRLRADSSILRTNCDLPWWQTNYLGLETGLANFTIPSGSFVPGAIADSLTSYGGLIFGDSGQTSLLAFINGGAAGSYGTVSEPFADPQKFPDPQVYFYQSRGFSLAECYYQSINVPYLGLIVAEPLAAPYLTSGTARWTGTNLNAVLSGTVQLPMRFGARYSEDPLQQVDLFVDGKYFQTLTNVAPCPGNLLNVALNGYPMSYAVPTNATVATVANGLAALINAPANANFTQVKAILHGDRVELQSTATNHVSYYSCFTDSAATNSPGRAYRVTYLSGAIPPQLTQLGPDKRGNLPLRIETPLPMACVVLASTNLLDWLPIFTNSLSTSVDFVDPEAANFSSRFYRLAGTLPSQRMVLSALPGNNSGFKLHVDTATILPYEIQLGTNLSDWTSVFTNLLGGSMDFMDSKATNSSSRFYRAKLSPQSPAPTLLVTNPPTVNGTLLRVDGAPRPYMIEVSTNAGQWTPLFTNLAPAKLQVSVNSSIGTATFLSTFLSASSDSLLNSTACGYRQFTIAGTPQPGSWLRLSLTKTNGGTVAVAVTNQVAGATATVVAGQLCSAINSSPALQDSAGVVTEDLSTDAFGRALFNVRALSPGFDAGYARVWVSGSLSSIPSTPATLLQKSSDLQPRDHLYVTAGALNYAITLPLDTTTLADGFHELTAVAYEGSHVRTQTRIVLPVLIQNSSLTATLTLGMAATNDVQGTYQITVAANTNNVSAISLFSTGGLLNQITNQPTATFTLNGPDLGVGLHPFYALVQTATGQRYRTAIQWARLVSQ